ncbi:hypothetical protein [Viscerimonas tarda]
MIFLNGTQVSTTVTDGIPPFGRNDSPVSGLRDEEVAAKPPLPHPLSQKGDRHWYQREESSAHIRNFTERYISSKILATILLNILFAGYSSK